MGAPVTGTIGEAVGGTTGAEVSAIVGAGVTGAAVGGTTGAAVGGTTGAAVGGTTGAGVSAAMGWHSQTVIRGGKKTHWSDGMRPSAPADSRIPQATVGCPGKTNKASGFPTSIPSPQTEHAL